MNTNHEQRLAQWASTLAAKPQEITSWARDGYDTPEWPYVRIYAAHTRDPWNRDTYTLITNTEGDRRRQTFTTAGELAAAIDAHCQWYWQRGYGHQPNTGTDDDHGPCVWSMMTSQPETGSCDHCNQPYTLGADDHNPDTGNHYHCESDA